MGVAINRRPQESLNRLLRRSARYESPGKQAAGGGKELQVDQRRSVDVGFPPEAGPNRAFRASSNSARTQAPASVTSI